MRVLIKSDFNAVSESVADYIKEKIRTHNKLQANKLYVLGLPTGGSIEKVYEHLIKFYNEKTLSFKNVMTFNMDEYIGLAPTHPQSYRYFMDDHLFKHIDINPSRINTLDGLAKDSALEANEYEKKIANAGGIDIFVGGIGRDGHLAFNEPGSSLQSSTRVKTLSEDTREANARFFGDNIDLVPKQALTVGVKTVTDAREVLLIASGANKSHAIQKVIEEGINHMYTASVLQMHPCATIVCDEDAASKLSPETYKYFKSVAG